MTVLALSPHLDDAAFSAGGLIARLGAAGHDVVVATVFTRSVPNPSGFALRCQTDKGLAPDAGYMAIRRAEDEASCARLGAQALYLDLAEAPHRGYESPEALFAGIRDPDRHTWRDVLTVLRALAGARAPHLVLTCQGLGAHVDHLHAVRAVAAFQSETGVPVAWWRDAPYALRDSGAAPAEHVPSGLSETRVPLDTAALDAKLDACAVYATQLPFQFGRDSDADPETALRDRMTAFARSESARLGADGLAEALLTGEPDVLTEALA